MSLSYHDALAQVTGPGSPFEIGPLVVDGIELKAFVHTPPTLRELFASTKARGEAIFLVYEDERWSFAEFASRVDAFAAMLVGHYGVKVGDRVAIGMRNYPEWIVAFGAITSIGAISVSLNAWWTTDELDFALSDSTPVVLVADRERVERTVDTCRRLGIKVVAVRAGDEPLAGADRLDDVVDPGAPMPQIDFGPQDDATILYTSGTTGRPKGAVSTHRAVIQALMAFACRGTVDGLRLANADPPADPMSFILVVPLFHVTGQVPVMLSCVAAGAKLVMMYKWEPERALQLIERERVTMFIGVPTQSWDLLECPTFSRYDTSSLVAVGGGGAPAPPELVKRVSNSFRTGRPQLGYGMTETNAYGPGHSGIDYIEHPTSTGRLVPIMEIEVRDVGGVAVPLGDTGEIWFKSPTLIRGFWRNPKATADTIVDGWLRSGDIGRLDAEGFVYVVDRAKDMVLRAGENVYCAEVEAAIYEHPDVYEAAVFGVPHERLGEEVACAVMFRPGASCSTDELSAHTRTRLAGFKVPTRWIVLDEPLPRNASGKILKRQLRDRL